MTLRTIVFGLAGAVVALAFMFAGNARVESKHSLGPGICYLGCFGGEIRLGRVDSDLCLGIGTVLFFLIVLAGAALGAVLGRSLDSRQ